MKKIILGFVFGLVLSSGAVYVEKIKINNWGKNDIKEIVKDVVNDCRVDNKRIEC